ncbi:MAG: hypothetical protein MAG794_00619 [Gammaproteobacteria bacterium]|nr:hypothetical protein [Gammaproteobacteria bacterium]
MKKWLSRTFIITALAATAALADGRSHIDGHYGYARVLGVDPLTEVVRVNEPREVCWVENVTRRRPRGSGSATPEILGGIIGGVVGNRFGSGRGKDIATVAGAILGGSIAHDVKRRRAYAYDAYTAPVERCRIEHEYYEEQRIVGYHVKYRYNRKVYQTRMDHDPGDTVKIRVNIAVAE